MPRDVHGTTVATYLERHDVDDLDMLAQLDGVSRSTWIRKAVRAELARRLPSQQAVLTAHREAAKRKAEEEATAT